MERTIQEVPDKPESITALANEFLTKLDDDSLEFVAAKDLNKHLTKYQEYYELWWREFKQWSMNGKFSK